MGLPRRVADLNPASFAGSYPTQLIAVGSSLFFRASQTLGDSELWKSDGTEAGTVRVADIRPGPSGSSPLNTPPGAVLGNTLFFVANDGSSGIELWKSDGTAAGTVRVADINPGGGNSEPYFLTPVGNNLYFSANDPVGGRELWKTDGITTSRVSDLEPGIASSFPINLTAFGGLLYFRAKNSIFGSLWKTNGVVSTRIDIRSAPYGSNPSNLTPFAGALFYSANDGSGFKLWKTDGTTSSLVSNTAAGSTAVAGANLFFTGGDSEGGEELWKTDGTTAGTMRVADIKPGLSSSNLANLTALGGTLYFTADDGSSGYELWKSDGITTVRVADINPGSASSKPANLTVVGNMLYFTANDGTEGSSGSELWKTDGTAAGTARVANISQFGGSNPSQLTVVGNTLYFVASDGATGKELWALDSDAGSDPIITLAVAPAVVTEDGSSKPVFTLTRTGSTTSSLVVNVVVSGTATFANDYTQSGASSFSATTAKVTFAAGAATATITIDPTADSAIEAPETVALTLASGSGYTIGTAAAVTGTISNDDGIQALPVITVPIVVPSVVLENGATNMVYSFIRTGSTAEALTIDVKVGGTATFGTDYTQTGASSFSGTAATVTFAPGANTASLTIDPTGDSLQEPDEIVELTLSPGATYAVGATLTATGTIVNDDGIDAPLLSSITVQGNQLLLQFSKPIAPLTSQDLLTLASRFVVKVADKSRRISAVVQGADPSGLSLTLAGIAPLSTKVVTLAYSDPSLANDNNGVVQDLAGNDLASVVTPRVADSFNSSRSVVALADSYRNLRLLGSSASQATGNGGANTITGNSVANRLIGGGGLDLLDGVGDSDIYLISSAADHPAAEINDSGISGSDELRFASTIAGQTLTVFQGDVGLERVSIGTGLAVNAVTTATTALNIDAALAPNGLTISGNRGENSLLGTAFADVLIGDRGVDQMNGGESSDLYLVLASSAHSAAEIQDSGTAGRDELRFASTIAGQTLTVFALDTGLESVTIGTGNGASPLTTGTTALNINAGLAPNGLTIAGNNGANTLIGTAFSDILTGNAGPDIFRFQTPLDPVTNVDLITDFTPTQSRKTTDLIQLENTGSGLFNGIAAQGPLAAGAFVTGDAFTASSQRIRYNPTSGDLFYDADGSDAAGSIRFATLAPNLLLTNLQFTVT